MHKHFRMVAILDSLRDSGVISAPDEHISPQQVWDKLGELYNLEALDERVSLGI